MQVNPTSNTPSKKERNYGLINQLNIGPMFCLIAETVTENHCNQ